MKIREGLTYDDVLLVPKYSSIQSRSEVDLSVELSPGFKFSHPIIPANMKTVVGVEMIDAISSKGGLAIMHRFLPLSEQISLAETYKNHNNVGFSIGVKEEGKRSLHALVEAGAKVICLDIAHGDSVMAEEMCDYIHRRFPQILLIAGNVSTGTGAMRLWRAGAHTVKVGVGPGSLCTTRIETGNGVPQLTALMDVAQARHSLLAQYGNSLGPLSIIADGGIKNAGDCVKALCFADMVMAGNLFAGTDESPGDFHIINGMKTKSYVGSSTHKGTHKEGVEAFVSGKGSVHEVLQKLFDGITSGCSYQDSKNLNQLKDGAEFVRITNAGIKESGAHDVTVIKDH